MEMETEIKSHYNYQEVILWLEKKGVELYGNHFKILESDYPIIYKLIAYFLKDEATCYRPPLLNKLYLNTVNLMFIVFFFVLYPKFTVSGINPKTCGFRKIKHKY
jgi:hypothetical protein